MTPELSVVIPTRNRPRMLRACLDSLAVQTESFERFEVVVVLDGVDPETNRALQDFHAPFELRVLEQSHAGASTARNRGVAEAHGSHCLFVDDDVVADPNLIAEHLQAQHAHRGVVGIGRIERILPHRAPRWARLQAMAWHGHFDRLADRTPTWNDCYAGNLCVPRDAFLRVGGFAADIEVGHDVEFAYRLTRAGLTVVHVPKALVAEDNRESLRHFVADARRRGRANWQFYERHPELLPQLPLGGAREMDWRWRALRRLLVAARVPPLLVASFGRLIPRSSRAARWYRFVYSYCHWRGIRDAVDAETWRRLQRGTAILMYHGVGRRPEPPSRFVIPEARFRRQLAWLALRKYSVLSLDEFVKYRLEHRLPPAKSVVITFDDGYADNFEIALPVLEEYSFPATFFLVSNASGTAAWASVRELAQRRLTSLSEANTYLGRVGFGAHTRTHPRLTMLTPVELEDEVGGSKRELEETLAVPVMTFAYPFGDVNDGVRAAVEQAGFLAACGIRSGRNVPATDRYELRRLEIRGSDSLFRFIVMLWLGDPRSLFRRG